MTLEAYPGGPNYPALRRSLINREFLASEYEKNPEGAPTEYGAQWARTLEPYLREVFVRRMFGPHLGEVLVERERGVSSNEYFAHGDPALTGDNFAFVIAHPELDAEARQRIIIDLIRVWSPADFPDGEIDHTQVEEEIRDLIMKFPMVQLTFDTWNSALVRQRLQRFANQAHLLRRLSVRTLTPTADTNRNGWETFKNALAENRIHCYPHDLAQAELLFLQRNNKKIEAPTSGPCTTDDVATAIMNVVVAILSREDPGRELAALRPRGSNPFGPTNGRDQAVFDNFSQFGRRQRFPHGAQRMSRRGARHHGGRSWR